MRIAQLEPANFGAQGDHIYRTAQPLRAMAKSDPEVRCLSGNWLSPRMRRAAEHADVLVLCKVVDVDLLPLVARRRARGLRTVYEINDDFTDVQPWNTTARFYAQPENRSLVFQLARSCDALQFSSPGLADKFGGLHPVTCLLPNQLAVVPPAHPRDPATTPIAIGWGGSYGHRDDLRMIVEPLRAVLHARPLAQLAIMGDTRLQDLFVGVPKARLRWVEPGPLAAYQEFVAGLDIGLAPLRPTGFNRGRSDVKYLEYASHSVVPVCSDETPYRASVRPGETGLLFSDADDLREILLRLVDDAALRTRIAENAYAAVASERLQSQHAERQLAFYRGLPGAPGTATDRQAFDASFDSAAQATPEEPGTAGNYRLCRPTAAEQHLYNALLSQSDPRQARRDCRAALEADPENFLVHMHLARFEPPARAAEHIARARALAPTSAAVRLTEATLAAQRNDAPGERFALEAALESAPSYAPALTRLAIGDAEAGRHCSAQTRYEAALVENPDYPLACVGLATLLASRGQLTEASALLVRHEQHAHHDPRYWQLRGQVALARQHLPDALIALPRALERLHDWPGPDAAALEQTVRPLLAKAYALDGQLDRARQLLSAASRSAAGE